MHFLQGQTVSPITLETEYFKDVPSAVGDDGKLVQTKVPKDQLEDKIPLEEKVAVVAHGRSVSWHGFSYRPFEAVTSDATFVEILLIPKKSLPDFLNCGFWRDNQPQSATNPFRRGFEFVQLM